MDISRKGPRKRVGCQRNESISTWLKNELLFLDISRKGSRKRVGCQRNESISTWLKNEVLFLDISRKGDSCHKNPAKDGSYPLKFRYIECLEQFCWDEMAAVPSGFKWIIEFYIFRWLLFKEGCGCKCPLKSFLTRKCDFMEFCWILLSRVGIELLDFALFVFKSSFRENQCF